MSKTILLAFGGNAITKAHEKGTRDEQWKNISSTCAHVAELVKQGHRIIITHGNGPQVGNLLLKNEVARDVVPPMPLDVCVANTQGSLGYAISQTLGNYLEQAGLPTPVVAVITQVVVDLRDPAFQNPTKYVGPFFSEEEAANIMAAKGHILREDSGRGWRRVVPSPEPLEIVEAGLIKGLLDSGTIVVAAGGGGIPVVRTAAGLVGAEAVIDKDLAGQLLAVAVEADAFLLLTEVERVCIYYGKPQQQELVSMTTAQARQYMEEGHFAPGSMGPKVAAAVRFVESGSGREAVIISLEKAWQAFSGGSGTVI
ncbi:MAG TPA: carbamate kinase, partial [Patescibacteria group bacterium]|nr:carbamate kinase [Patescibacteria group bacterium]